MIDSPPENLIKIGLTIQVLNNLLITTKRKRLFPNGWSAISFFMKLINLDNLLYILFQRK